MWLILGFNIGLCFYGFVLRWSICLNGVGVSGGSVCCVLFVLGACLFVLRLLCVVILVPV